MTEHSSFLIRNQKQIIRYLLLLSKNDCLIKATFGANDESYITSVLSINEKNNTLILDCGSKEDLNLRIMKSEKITFDTKFEGIKVSFAGSTPKQINYEEESVFTMPIPKTLFWMERRGYYRVKPKLSKPIYCKLILENGRSVELKLYDISLSGFSMLNVSREVSEKLTTDTLFSDCDLILPEYDNCMVSFEISNKYIINPDKLKKVQKIGCQFKNLTRQVENIINSYMHNIQREALQIETQNEKDIAPYRKKIIVYMTNH